MNLKFLKTKDKKYLESSQRGMPLHLWRKDVSNDSKLLIRDHEVIRKGHSIFLVQNEKEPSTLSFISSENILQEWKDNQDILRGRNTKRIVCSRTSLKWIRKFWKQRKL